MAKSKPQKKDRGHRWLWTICHWPVCAHCGLIWLKNEATDKAARGPCRNAEEE